MVVKLIPPDKEIDEMILSSNLYYNALAAQHDRNIDKLCRLASNSFDYCQMLLLEDPDLKDTMEEYTIQRTLYLVSQHEINRRCAMVEREMLFEIFDPERELLQFSI